MSNKSKELLEVSPYGKVPVVVVDGKAIYESAVINEYLEEIYPEVRLMPEDPFLRAMVRIWTDFAASQLSKPLYRVYKPSNPEIIAQDKEDLVKELDFMEKHLESNDGKWFVGDEFTLADINLLPFAHILSKIEGGLISAYPAINHWFETFQQRPSYAATLQDI